MPKFSVIIPSVNGLPTIAECLTALERQNCDFDFEVIVVDRTRNGTAEFIRENFSTVKLIKLSAPCGIPEMRFIAINQAAGEYLAVIEDHCIVPENWLAKLFKAHETGYQVVGGAVENVSRKTLINRAVFLCEYSAFMPPIASGETAFVTGNNTSYQSSVVKQLDAELLKNYWEYFLLSELKRKGIKFFADNSIIADHKKDFGFFYFLSQRFYYSRSFAAMRKGNSTFFQQILQLLYTPFLPFHQMWKIFQNVRAKNRNYLDFFLSLPLLMIFMISYALGEFTGCLFGSGESLLKVE